MDGNEQNRTTRSEDAEVEAAVLHHLLEIHPEPLTTAELARELLGEDPEFGERDAVDRAVRDLVAVGLLHHSAELVMPTRAALRFQALSEG